MHEVSHHRWLFVLLLAGSGCSMLGAGQADYQTVATDMAHDTDRAIAEHAKAVRIINRRLAGKEVDLDKAEKHLQQALAADVTYGPAHNSLGLVHYLRRTLYLAAWEFEYAAKLMPDRVEPYHNLGLVYECADNLDRAIVYYEQALAQRPTNPVVLGSLARARLRSGASVDEIRPYLQELLFYDTRPEWIEWAREVLGRNPEQAGPRASPLDTEIVPPGPAVTDEVPLLHGLEGDDEDDPQLPEPLPAPALVLPDGGSPEEEP